MKVQFSVAIPTYNRSDYLSATLDSILSQTTPPNEIVVVDDGSTDSTPAILQKYRGKLRSIRIENSGPGHARKVAVEACNNQWVALCDSDDLWQIDHLTRFSDAIDTHPDLNILISNFDSFGELPIRNSTHFQTAGRDWFHRYGDMVAEDEWILSQPYQALLEFNPAYPSGMAFTKEIYEKSGGIIDKYSRWKAEDAEFTRRLVAASTARVWLDSKVSWSYRRHGDNFSQTQWKNIQARAVIIEEHLRRGIVPEYCITQAKDMAERSRGLAFDTAYWTGFYEDAAVLYGNVAPQQKSLTRKVKRILCSLKSVTT